MWAHDLKRSRAFCANELLARCCEANSTDRRAHGIETECAIQRVRSSPFVRRRRRRQRISVIGLLLTFEHQTATGSRASHRVCRKCWTSLFERVYLNSQRQWQRGTNPSEKRGLNLADMSQAERVFWMSASSRCVACRCISLHRSWSDDCVDWHARDGQKKHTHTWKVCERCGTNAKRMRYVDTRTGAFSMESEIGIVFKAKKCDTCVYCQRIISSDFPHICTTVVADRMVWIFSLLGWEWSRLLFAQNSPISPKNIS